MYDRVHSSRQLHHGLSHQRGPHDHHSKRVSLARQKRQHIHPALPVLELQRPHLVQNKDLGAAGDSLSDMVATLRGFDTDALEKPGFFARLFGRAKPIVKFLQRYEGVRKQIDKISNELDSHKTKLLTDITSLDRLYEANLQYFHDLELYIAAGDEKLRQLDTIP